MKDIPFKFLRPKSAQVPVLLSSPHSGQEFPVGSRVRQEHLRFPQDTDWFVDQLYGFASELGCTQICAKYSRYVIDLNRSPENRALYGDGRAETGLIPMKSFSGEAVYDQAPSEGEKQRRLKLYYHPYYEAIERELKSLREKFGKALLLDCHSIRRSVPSIAEKPFPDLILGDASGEACVSELSQRALEALKKEERYDVSYNEPFRGGHLTRHFGRPGENIFALQLEMSQDLYMDEGARQFDAQRASEIQSHLKAFVGQLIEWIKGN